MAAADATGEAQTGPLWPQFDRTVKLAFCGSSISSDGGPLLHRELDEPLGLTDLAAGLIGEASWRLPQPADVGHLDSAPLLWSFSTQGDFIFDPIRNSTKSMVIIEPAR